MWIRSSDQKLYNLSQAHSVGINPNVFQDNGNKRLYIVQAHFDKGPVDLQRCDNMAQAQETLATIFEALTQEAAMLDLA